MQNKDVIYIDVEDDITAIIGKVKAAKEKIVALVPPKRTGVLQSAVNLRLLARAANSADKRLVLITGNAALSSLAASAEIPVAKNLHSRPELAKPEAIEDEDDDVIEGDQVSVGDHAKSSKDADDDIIETVPAASIAGLDIDGESTSVGTKKAEPKEKKKRGIKVPDFGTFRKKMVIGGVAGVFALVFLFWAFWIAPHATLVVSAKTTGQFLNIPVTLGTDLETNVEKATIKSVQQTEKITQSVEFEATGKKNIGDKATGTIKFTQQSLSQSTIPSGTRFTSGDGFVFVTNSGVTVPASSFGPGCFPTACPGTANVNVTALEGGADYNGQSGGLSGTPAGMSASFTGSTAGGTDKMATVVTQDDIDKAQEQLADEKTDDAKKTLKSKFKKTDVVIDGSFNSKGEDPKSTPAVGQEASDGKAKLTSEVTYTMSAVAKDELDSFLDESFEATLTSKDSQRVYDNGLKDVSFDDYKTGDPNDTAMLATTAQVGPKINDDDIKERAKGKRTGEVMGDIKGIDGVSDVEVKLSPFWVTGVPDDTKKITIEFKLVKND